MTSDEESDEVTTGIHAALADYFAKREDGTMLTQFLVYAEVMDGKGEESVWIVPSNRMSLVTKMGISAYLVENYRGQMQHGQEDTE